MEMNFVDMNKVHFPDLFTFLSRRFSVRNGSLLSAYDHVVYIFLHVDCEQSLFCSKIRGEKEAEHESRARSQAASSARGGRRAKRETAMVSYNDCEARHSGDGVILLVDDDAQLSAIFISDMRGEFEPYFAVLERKESA